MGVVLLCAALGSPGQLATRAGDPEAQNAASGAHRTRLILKDGSYQVVLRYKVVGSRVEYVSAERGGETEEIPLDLVDLEATKKWEQSHAAPVIDANGVLQRPAPPLDPEVAKEEADRLALSPEVAPRLRLVPEDSLLALDTWRGVPELVPLAQTAGDLNRKTGHSVLRAIVNPYAASHQILEIPGEKAPVQLHVGDPAFYVRADDDAAPAGEVMTVDTHGASTSEGVKEAHRKKGASRYAIVRVDVRQGARVVASFNISKDWVTKKEEDVVETRSALLPGGHWLKVEPVERLLFGEYCVVEILDDHQINMSVWDFGVHPGEPENRDAIRPKEKRNGLERRETP